jgi:hypothetical protein
MLMFKEEFKRVLRPLCLSLTRKKTGISFITFVTAHHGCNTSSWYFSSKIPVVGIKKNLPSKLLKDYLADWKFEDNMSIYAMSPEGYVCLLRKQWCCYIVFEDAIMRGKSKVNATFIIRHSIISFSLNVLLSFPLVVSNSFYYQILLCEAL